MLLLRFPAWKIAVVLGVLIAGTYMFLPNVVPQQYGGWFVNAPMKLGLDLRGGASILLEVSPEEVRANRLNELSRDVRGALVQQRPQITTSMREVRNGELHVRTTSPEMAAEAVKRIQDLGKPPVGTIGQSNTLDVALREDGVIVATLTEQAFQRLQVDALNSSIEAVRRRIDNSGVAEPSISKQGDSRISVEMPGLSDPAPLIDVLTQAGVLTFNLVDESANAANYEPGVPRNGRIALPDDSMGGQLVVVFEEPIITGSDLQTASQAFDEYNRPSINFQLRGQGAQRFGRATTENVGRRFAIVLDSQIVSAPTIQSPITTGSGRITGSFSVQEAENTAVILRSGALPAKLQVAERRVVGPGLGQDSIDMGVTATVVGMVLISIFMVVAYGMLGFFALIPLFLNLVLMIAILSLFGATLTLPGIAGILLTMGMAVDANVLIYERMREEKRSGRSVVSSVETGYEQAFMTIVDANLTTLLAAGTMFFIGSGPVRGFAVTLSVGILTSMFTAVLVSRLIMAVWLRYTRPKWLPI